MTAAPALVAREASLDADTALEQLYAAHWRRLVRLAVLLLRDQGAAEEVVQDAFVRVSRATLRDPDKTLAYLRQAVVNGARSKLRRRLVARRHVAEPPPDVPSAEHSALAADTRRTVVTALRGLPMRQREVLVLRYYGELSESAIAAALGVTNGAVKTHASRGLAALSRVLEDR